MAIRRVGELQHSAEIMEAVQRIIVGFEPLLIVLFGSHARGDAGVDSDLDFLVVLSEVGSKRAARVAIRVALADFNVPVDIIVSTPGDVERRRHVPGTLVEAAMAEGVVLYDRSL